MSPAAKALAAVTIVAILAPGLSVTAQTTPNLPLPTSSQRQRATMPNTVPQPQPSTTGGSALYSSTEAAIEQQSKGQYQTMDRSPSLPLGTLQRAWDSPRPTNGQSAPGVVHFMWHPDFVMSVRTRDFMVTSIIFPQWERVAETYIGDPVVFEVKKVRANVVAVRSRNAGADSNLTVIGSSGQVYNFYIRSESWNSNNLSDVAVYVEAPSADALETPVSDPMVGSFPRSQNAHDSLRHGLPDYLREVVPHPDNLQFDMKMYANTENDAEIAPERVFHDGIFTYFDFGSRADAIRRPVVHLQVDGVDTAVNTRTVGPNGNVLVAEAVGDFTLRNGGKVVCIRWAGAPPRTGIVAIGDRGVDEPPPQPPRDQVTITGAPEGKSSLSRFFDFSFLGF